MVGSPTEPRLKTKAIETFGICSFLVAALDKYRRFFQHDYATLKESGTLLLAFLADLKSCKIDVPPTLQQRLLDQWKRFVRLTADYDLNIPKTHLVFHLILRMGYQGNPWFYHTFVDESLNKTLKKVLRWCQQSTFEAMCLAKASELLRRMGAKRQRG